jgi:hypothetical protein
MLGALVLLPSLAYFLLPQSLFGAATAATKLSKPTSASQDSSVKPSLIRVTH